jgi:hypothetical protein
MKRLIADALKQMQILDKDYAKNHQRTRKKWRK